MVGFIYKFQKDMVMLKCNHYGEEKDQNTQMQIMYYDCKN